MKRWMLAAAMGAVLTGCAQPPTPERVALSSPPGLALPLKGRAMVYVAEADLDRKFSYDLNRVSTEKTDIPEGKDLARAAQAVLSKAFVAVATNDPSIRPDVIARVSGKAVWNQRAAEYRVTCELDAYRADGDPIGHYFNAYKSSPLFGFRNSLPRVYAQCLKGTAEQLVRAPAVAAMAHAGFPPPDPRAVAAYLRSQGFVVTAP